MSFKWSVQSIYISCVYGRVWFKFTTAACFLFTLFFFLPLHVLPRSFGLIKYTVTSFYLLALSITQAWRRWLEMRSHSQQGAEKGTLTVWTPAPQSKCPQAVPCYRKDSGGKCSYTGQALRSGPCLQVHIRHPRPCLLRKHRSQPEGLHSADDELMTEPIPLFSDAYIANTATHRALLKDTQTFFWDLVEL